MSVEGSPPAGAVPGFAIVRLGTSRSWLRPGDEVTFGRGEDRALRIGHDPHDDLISRDAGSLTGLRDGVLIRNTSRTQPIRFLAMPGPEISIGPGMAVGSMPFGQVRLDLLGRHGACYTLHLDSRGMTVPPRLDQPGDPAPDRGTGPTRFGPGRISARELTLLAALCEPVLTGAGSRPATYRQIAERLGGSATHKSVRTGLDRLRNRLADDDGIPGLRTDDDLGREAPHYAESLARWAIDTRQVGPETLELVLPASRTVGRVRSDRPA